MEVVVASPTTKSHTSSTSVAVVATAATADALSSSEAAAVARRPVKTTDGLLAQPLLHHDTTVRGMPHVAPPLAHYPNHHPPPQLPQGRERLQEAFDLLPDSAKGAYAEALRTAPHLIELESNPDRYLAFDKYDPWAAAKRIADYWEARVELFGRDRAFRPLLGSGSDGALDAGDLEVLQTGNFMVLPEDVHGSPVLYFDRARLNRPELTDPRKYVRCFFYILSAASELDGSRDPGLASLSVFSNKTRQSTINAQLSMEMLSLFFVRRIIPVRLARLHAANVSTRPGMASVLATLLDKVALGGVRIPRVTFHSGRTNDELQESLRSHGFRLDGIPKTPLGGLFTLGCFRRWLDEQARTEKRRLRLATTAGGVGREEGPAAHVAGDDSGSGSDAERAPCHDDPEVDSDEDPEQERLRRKREREAAAARRKRARRKINAQVLRAEVQRHREQQLELQQEEANLVRRLAEARRIVGKARENRPNPQPRAETALTAAARPSLSGAPNRPQWLPETLIGQSRCGDASERRLSSLDGLGDELRRAVPGAGASTTDVSHLPTAQLLASLGLSSYPAQPAAYTFGRDTGVGPLATLTPPTAPQILNVLHPPLQPPPAPFAATDTELLRLLLAAAPNRTVTVPAPAAPTVQELFDLLAAGQLHHDSRSRRR